MWHFVVDFIRINVTVNAFQIVEDFWKLIFVRNSLDKFAANYTNNKELYLTIVYNSKLLFTILQNYGAVEV